MPAVERERGLVVVEPQRSRLDDRQVAGVRELEMAQRGGPRVRPGEPAGVRREGEPGGLAVLAAVDLAHLARLAFDEQDAPVVRGDGGPAAVGRDGEAQNAAELPRRQPARCGRGREAGRRRELERVLALRVGHPDDMLLAVHAEGPRRPGPYAGLLGERPRGPVPMGDPVDAAADLRPRCRVRCGRVRRSRRGGRPARGGAAGRCAGRRAGRPGGGARLPSRSSRSHSSPASSRTRHGCRRSPRAGRRTRRRGCGVAARSRRAATSTRRRRLRGRRGRRRGPPPTAGTRCSRRGPRGGVRTSRRPPGRSTTCPLYRPGSASRPPPRAPSWRRAAARRCRTPHRRPARTAGRPRARRRAAPPGPRCGGSRPGRGC